ncbi:unnamed protein product [Protopolystoma xenopodis]|uniref:Uncharacterized protein n=1 Tax=Protopolystoma xenopodis TaxID=117903 RepID=A0A3S5B4C0_9PLAT|nr:unnamed protein product [Protopolystoma xenopodis]
MCNNEEISQKVYYPSSSLTDGPVIYAKLLEPNIRGTSGNSSTGNYIYSGNSTLVSACNSERNAWRSGDTKTVRSEPPEEQTCYSPVARFASFTTSSPATSCSTGEQSMYGMNSYNAALSSETCNRDAGHLNVIDKGYRAKANAVTNSDKNCSGGSNLVAARWTPTVVSGYQAASIEALARLQSEGLHEQTELTRNAKEQRCKPLLSGLLQIDGSTFTLSPRGTTEKAPLKSGAQRDHLLVVRAAPSKMVSLSGGLGQACHKQQLMQQQKCPPSIQEAGYTLLETNGQTGSRDSHVCSPPRETFSAEHCCTSLPRQNVSMLVNEATASTPVALTAAGGQHLYRIGKAAILPGEYETGRSIEMLTTGFERRDEENGCSQFYVPSFLQHQEPSQHIAVAPHFCEEVPTVLQKCNQETSGREKLGYTGKGTSKQAELEKVKNKAKLKRKNESQETEKGERRMRSKRKPLRWGDSSFRISDNAKNLFLPKSLIARPAGRKEQERSTVEDRPTQVF